VVVCSYLPHVNVTALALILVAEVVGLALCLGRIEAVTAAIVASMGLDYYFLPPPGFGIESPEHRIVLFAFLATAFGTALAKARASEKKIEAEIGRRSDELKSAVFSALAHDARGPLSSIKIAATTLLSDRPGNAAQQRELTGMILEEVDRMNGWLDAACELSQMGAGQFTLHKGPRRLKDLVRGAVDGLGSGLAGRPLEIDIPETLPRAQCDGEMTQLVLRLLLDNAVKYSPPGAPITISSALEKRTLLITVADAGPGIPERDRTRIFEKYYRGAQREAGVPGMGLGLASARFMLESQGGRIWVSNRPGGGAAFHFTLPAAMGIAL